VLKVVERFLPTLVITDTAASAINAAIKPYSMAVAPASSLSSRIKVAIIVDSLHRPYGASYLAGEPLRKHEQADPAALTGHPEMFLNCSHPADATDLRLLRLIDLDPRDIVQVNCPGCGWLAEYTYGMLQRLHHLPSTMLVFDLQFRYRCKQCNCTSGFRITVWDDRSRGDRSADRRERVIVPGDAPRYQRALAVPPRRVE
jgi:hypothetical protein